MKTKELKAKKKELKLLEPIVTSYFEGYEQGEFDVLITLDLVYGRKFFDEFILRAEKEVGWTFRLIDKEKEDNKK
jgi:hypothetical protein